MLTHSMWLHMLHMSQHIEGSLPLASFLHILGSRDISKMILQKLRWDSCNNLLYLIAPYANIPR